MIEFDARYLARGWLAVAHATGGDKETPQLYKTLQVEAHADGVRLTATDRYVLLTTWVPALGKEDQPAPELDEKPVSIAVAQDGDGRAKQLLTYLLKLAGDLDENDDPLRVEMHVGHLPSDFDEDTTSPTFEGFEGRWVAFEHPGWERVKIPVYDGAYPHWRRLLEGFAAKKTSAIALRPEIAGRLAKLAQVLPGCALVWHFGGVNKMARFELGHSEPAVHGAVMPIRWDFEVDDGDAPSAASGDADSGAAEPGGTEQ